jgi:hypothetical protein
MKKIEFLPISIFGKLSLALVVTMPIWFFIGMSMVDFYDLIPAGGTIPRDIIARPGVALPMLIGMACGVAAGFIGMVGIVKKKDYSVLTLLSSALGFLMLLWVLAEIIFPH